MNFDLTTLEIDEATDLNVFRALIEWLGLDARSKDAVRRLRVDRASLE